MVTKAHSITNINALPLYPAPAMDFRNSYQALKICQNISTAVAPSRKTIITLDLQLYAKAFQLQGKNEIAHNFVFRPGELHIASAFQHAIGKYIENSGIDQSFIDCDIYGPVTVSKILNGKLMKRGMEAYMVLYLALNKICLKDFSKTFPETLKVLNHHEKAFANFLIFLTQKKPMTPRLKLLLRKYLKKSFFKLIRISKMK